MLSHLNFTLPMVVTLAVLAGLLYGLVKDKPADVMFVGAVVLLAAFGVIAPDDAFSGFANSAMLIVAALFVVAAGLRETGVMEYVGEHFLGHVETEAKALFYMAVVLIPSAMVLNNTPKVALLVPVLIAWCRKRRISPSRLLMPLVVSVDPGGHLLADRHQHQPGRPGHADQEPLETDGLLRDRLGGPALCAFGGHLSLDGGAEALAGPQGPDRAARSRRAGSTWSRCSCSRGAGWWARESRRRACVICRACS